MRKEVAEKFGYKQAYIVGLRNRLLQKVNLLFAINPQFLFDSYPKNAKNKFLKEYATEDEEVKALLLSKLKNIAVSEEKR